MPIHSGRKERRENKTPQAEGVVTTRSEKERKEIEDRVPRKDMDNRRGPKLFKITDQSEEHHTEHGWKQESGERTPASK